MGISWRMWPWSHGHQCECAAMAIIEVANVDLFPVNLLTIQNAGQYLTTKGFMYKYYMNIMVYGRLKT